MFSILQVSSVAVHF